MGALSADAPVSLDHLIETLEGNSSSEIIAALFELELSGLVRQLPGKSFLKVWAEYAHEALCAVKERTPGLPPHMGLKACATISVVS